MLIPDTTLREKALEDCRQHLKKIIPDDIVVALMDAETQWSAVQLRHVFEQAMAVWRRLGDLEIILNRNGQAVGFVNEANWRDCQWQRLSEQEVAALVKQTGMIRKGFSVEKVLKGDRNCLEAFVIEHPDKERYKVQINPARRTIISLQPVVE